VWLMQPEGKLPHVCFLAVSAGVLKVRLDTKAPEKFSDIYIYLYCSPLSSFQSRRLDGTGD